MVECFKCLECKKYNDKELIEYSCSEYKKIPEKILKEQEKCKYFKK